MFIHPYNNQKLQYMNLLYIITWTITYVLSFSEYVEWLINTVDNIQTIRFQVVS